MKTYREFVAEVARPIAGDEINFLNKHTIILIDYPIDVEDQFTGGDITKFKRLADYFPGEDAAVYEGNINLKGNDEINKAECELSKKDQILKKIIDESNLDESTKLEYYEILSTLSEENIDYAIDNSVDLIEFANKLAK